MEKELPISIHVHIRKEDCFLPDDTQVDFEDIIGERKLSLIAISEEYDLYKYTYTCDDSRIGNDNRYGICSKNRIPITPQIYRDVYYRNNFLIARKFGTLIDILNLQGQILFNSIKNIEEHSKYTILTNVKDETTFLNNNGCRLSQELKELKNKEYIKIFFKNDKMYYLNSLIVNSKNDTLTSVNIFKQINYEKHIFENRIDIHDCFNNSTYAYKPINETSEVYVFTIDSKYEILFSIDHIQIIPHYEKIELIPLKYYSFYKIYSNNLVGILDAKTGNELCPPIYDEIYCEEKGFKLQKDNKIGYFFLEKKYIIETKYDDIYLENNNIILKIGNKVGVITDSWHIIEPQYHDINKLKYGYYAYTNGNNWGIINEQNEIIIETKYDDIYLENNNIILKIGNKVGVITDSWHIIEPQYHDINKLKYGYYAYTNGNNWGIINEQNEIILEPYFNNITSKKYEDGLFFGMLIDGYWQVADLKKKIILNDIYDYIECRKRAIYARKGRNMFSLNDINNNYLFWNNNSCGYTKNTSILSFDSKLADLLTS